MTQFKEAYIGQPLSAAEAVMTATDSSFDNTGAVEQLQEELRNTRRLLAALIQHLMDECDFSERNCALTVLPPAVVAKLTRTKVIEE